LRTHGSVAQAYGALKRQAAAEAGTDREAYVKAKQAFIENVLAHAAEESTK
jgi:GrpB-like predicted nucleotidyltransferase (UPF0157 family)